jgi:hypothetical protein
MVFDQRKGGPEFAVANNQALIRIEQGETRRETLNCIEQLALGFLRAGFTKLACVTNIRFLHDVLAEDKIAYNLIIFRGIRRKGLPHNPFPQRCFIKRPFKGHGFSKQHALDIRRYIRHVIGAEHILQL